MAKQIEVAVVQADIDRGIKKDSGRCVVATAIARTIPDATRINVDVQAIRFTSGDTRYAYMTPPVVAGYVVAFDAGDDIHPFKFRLRSDQCIEQRRRIRTEAGNAAQRAKAKAKRTKEAAAKKVEAAAKAKKVEAAAKAEAAEVDDLQAWEKEQQAAEATQEAREAARQAREAKQAAAEAEAEREAVLSAYRGQAQIQRVDTDKRPPIPSVFKNKERAYGMRLLRINQH